MKSDVPRDARGFRQQKREPRMQVSNAVDHGWWRRGEDVQSRVRDRSAGAEAGENLGAAGPLRSARRQATGAPFVLFIAVGLATGFCLTHVRNRLHLLEIAQSIGEMTAEHDLLRDRREQLEAERAFLAHPDKIRRQAQERLGMHVTPPELIQPISVKNSPRKPPTTADTLPNGGEP
jgi:hypothetical protein